MKTLSISEAQARFKDLPKLVQNEPIQIQDDGQLDCVILSLKDYDQLQSESEDKKHNESQSEPLIDRVRRQFSGFDQRIDWDIPDRGVFSQDRIPFKSSK